MPTYAANTSVSVEKSRAEIETILTRYGASHFGYMTGPGKSIIEFVAEERRVRFTLPLPDKDAHEFKFVRYKGRYYETERTAEKAHEAWEQACRQRWRALRIAIMAKLEAVQCGISQFEEEFLSYVVDPCTNRTVYESIAENLQLRYEGKGTGQLLALPAPRKDD